MILLNLKKSSSLRTVLFIISLFIGNSLWAQVKIGDNPASINANSLLELESANKGLLIPRVALSASNNASPLASHVSGMIVYNTATAGSGTAAVSPGFYYNNGSQWVKVANSTGTDATNDAWVNNPTNTSVELGTLSDGTTVRPNDAKVSIDDGGSVLIGTDAPLAFNALSLATYPTQRSISLKDNISHPTLDFQASQEGIIKPSGAQFRSIRGGTEGNSSAAVTLNTGTGTEDDATVTGNRTVLARYNDGNFALHLRDLSAFRSETDASSDGAIGITKDNELRFWSAGKNPFSLVTDYNAPSMIIDATENVGIGTATPANRLDVNGKVNVRDLTGAAAATDRIVTADATTGELKRTTATLSSFDATNDAWVNNPTSTRVELGTLSNGTTVRPAANAFVALDNGNVGIGTNTPSSRLHMLGGSMIMARDFKSDYSILNNSAHDITGSMGINETAILRLVNTSDPAVDNTAILGFNAANGGGSSWGIGSVQTGTANSENNFHIFYSNGGGYFRRLTVLANGNVGIGTATPANRLDVNGKVNVRNLTGAAATTDRIVTADATTGELKRTTATLSSFDATNDAWVNNVANTRIELGTKSDGTARDANTQFVALDNGNVGIGTATPASKVHIDLDNAPGVGQVFLLERNVSTTGNFGLTLRNKSTALNSQLGIAFSNPIGLVGGILPYIEDATTAQSGLQFRTRRSDGVLRGSLYINSQGDVAIGTDILAPTHKLDVNGKVRVRDLTGTAAATDRIVTADATTGELKRTTATLSSFDATNDAWVNNPTSTRVELGTLSNGTTARPTADAFVALDNGNVGIGTATPANALVVANNTATDGTADAMINDIRVGKGNGNVAGNTAIGASSLAANTTGNNNTAVGNSSLLANTTGINNTAVGTGSLTANTTGFNNTALGFNSLATNTTGLSNTALGISSLSANTMGNFNAAVGGSSLATNTTGNNNTALGISSLRTNTTGSSNTALGHSSLYSNTVGTGNIAIGYQSGYDQTGSDNTYIGRDIRGNFTGSGNIVIGTRNYSADVAALAASNTIFINANNGAERMRIINNGNVGIGTTSPNSRLHMLGGSMIMARDTNPGSILSNSAHDITATVGTTETAILRLVNTSDPDVNNTAILGFNAANGGGASWGIGSVQTGTTNFGNNFHIFYSNGGGYIRRFTVLSNGNVGINNTNPAYALDVNGDINTTGNIRKNGVSYNHPDYVFESYFEGISTYNTDYKMKSLKEVEAFVKEHKHLPGVQSRDNIKEANSWNISENVRVNLEKIEELYLHTIEQNKEISQLQKENKELKKRLDKLESVLSEK